MLVSLLACRLASGTKVLAASGVGLNQSLGHLFWRRKFLFEIIMENCFCLCCLRGRRFFFSLCGDPPRLLKALKSIFRHCWTLAVVGHRRRRAVPLIPSNKCQNDHWQPNRKRTRNFSKQKMNWLLNSSVLAVVIFLFSKLWLIIYFLEIWDQLHFLLLLLLLPGSLMKKILNCHQWKKNCRSHLN